MKLNLKFTIISGLLLLSNITGCTNTWLPSAGPSKTAVTSSAQSNSNFIKVVELDQTVSQFHVKKSTRQKFNALFEENRSPKLFVGLGDTLEVSIWEAPPASLFGSTVVDPRAGISTTRVTTFPEQVINGEGTITVPFAGALVAAGKTLSQIEAEIAKRLQGKANQPQVLVRTTRNVSSNVTIVGEVNLSLRMPVTAKGETILDAIAAAGGVRHPIGRTTIQLARGDRVHSLPLDLIIQDPKQNIMLQGGDVITALFQPLSFTVLGATGKNEEVNFESQGITLAQALGRAGGLQDTRADAAGVFIFRFEDPTLIDGETGSLPKTAEGKVAVVYRANMKDPATFFAAQSFPIKNRDILYVSNASGAELQKFMNLMLSGIYPALGIIQLAK